METEAALYYEANRPLSIETVHIDAPRPREVLVRTAATGVCHSDLHFVDGLARLPADRPTAMGHEGSGVVEAAGSDVTSVAVGDHVVTCPSGFCGTCAQCLSGHPNLCARVNDIVSRPPGETPRLSQSEGIVRQFLGVSSHAGHMLLHENSLVKIAPEIPLDCAALLSCGVLTGVGAALRTAGIEAGQTVAVLGCGGVGLSAIQGARLAGAAQIIAVDLLDRKLELAETMGATHVLNSADSNLVEGVRELTGGLGVDHALEAVGNLQLISQAVECLAVRGTATLVGVPPAGSTISFPSGALRPECRVQTSRMGSNRFRVDIPKYLEFYKQGRLLLEEMITRRARLEDMDSALDSLRSGEAARTVLLFD